MFSEHGKCVINPFKTWKCGINPFTTQKCEINTFTTWKTGINTFTTWKSGIYTATTWKRGINTFTTWKRGISFTRWKCGSRLGPEYFLPRWLQYSCRSKIQINNYFLTLTISRCFLYTSFLACIQAHGRSLLRLPFTL